MDIPIVINNFNRVTTTRKLAEDLSKLGYINIHILDNKSTYPPLLEWYESLPYKVIPLSENMEQLAVYNSGLMTRFYEQNIPWIVYSDSDIELNPFSYPGFIERIIELAEKYNITKAGLALKIDDLPRNPYADHYRSWEERYWFRELEKDVYDAHIDTTFCILKPGLPFDYQAIRIGGDLTAKHVPWYTDFSNMDEEEIYYLEHAKGWSTYKRYYYSTIKKQTHETA